jgi:hypothetical protein
MNLRAKDRGSKAGVILRLASMDFFLRHSRPVVNCQGNTDRMHQPGVIVDPNLGTNKLDESPKSKDVNKDAYLDARNQEAA